MGSFPGSAGVRFWFPALWSVRTGHSRMEGEDTTHNRDLVLWQGEILRLFMYLFCFEVFLVVCGRNDTNSRGHHASPMPVPLPDRNK